LSLLNDVFITNRAWQNLGGLCGLSMTLQSIGNLKFNVHGPPNIDVIFELTKLFGVTNTFRVNQTTFDNSPFVDSNIKIDYVSLHKTCNKMDQANDNLSHKKLKLDERRSDVYAYVCKLVDKPGPLLIKKCMELKVPSGPMLGQLKSGKDITLTDGTVVRSQDVRGPDEPGAKFIILDCPSLDYIDSLIDNQDLNPTVNSSLSENANLVVHFGPLEVVQDERYQKYISRFSSSTIHLGLNENNPNMAYVGANEMQYKLRYIDPLFFPLLNNSSQIDHIVNPFYTALKTSAKYMLRPSNKQGICNNDAAEFNEQEVQEFLENVEDLPEALEDYKKNVNDLNIDLNESDEPEVIFLGTGSAIPGKIRNSSCILISIDKDTLIMLDCGEGSFGQFYRYFGDKCEEMLRKLKLVFLSHLHADHQIGIISFLVARKDLNLDPLIVLGPTSVIEWLKNYSQVFEPIDHLYKTLITTEMLKGCSDNEMMAKYKLKEIKTIRVPHCRDSCGVLLTLNTQPEYKIVYSGDAMPSDSLIHHGRDCDLLIHEATMGDDLIEEAKLKRHSTSSQAIEVGRRMKAKHIILTHFSQRYSKLPYLNDEFDKTVGVAYDNMSIKLSSLPKLHHLLEPLRLIFSDHYENLLKKSEIKEKSRQRIALTLQKFR